LRRAAKADRRLPLIVFVAALAALCACAPTPPPGRASLHPTTFAALDGWAADTHDQAARALARSCAARDASAAAPGTGAAGLSDTAWDAPCGALDAAVLNDRDAARAFFERWFAPWRIDGTGLFTGYYEPEVRGALAPGGRYAVPLYRRPPEVVAVDLGEFRDAWRGERIAGRVEDGRLHPLPTRAEIDAGALAGRGLEIAWLDDAADAFFLQIQGSGRVRLPDGTLRRVGYDGGNGRPYTAIGRVLVERGAMPLEAVSMQSIRAWLAAHPDEADELMRRNASYVFFRWLDGDGPLGTQRTVLVPGRSLAVDPRFVPLGVPVWIDVDGDGGRLRRLTVAQDTGGAIRGAVRGDVFFGAGPDAAEAAGRLRAPGLAWLLLPKAERVAGAGDPR
jgi:membrane-bound lytic murein transglycosylase A